MLQPIDKNGNPIQVNLFNSKIEYDGSNNPIYVGYSNQTDLAVAKWAIQKIVYDGSNPTDFFWTDGVCTFDRVWNNRASYTY